MASFFQSDEETKEAVKDQVEEAVKDKVKEKVTYTVQEVAEKHGVSIAEVEALLSFALAVEENKGNLEEVAMSIALAFLFERLDHYSSATEEGIVGTPVEA